MPRPQFTLRALLVATAVVALLVAGWAGRARNQREAVDLLLAKGCDVYYRHQEVVPEREWVLCDPPVPWWLRRWLGDDYFRTPTAVYLDGSFTDDDLDTLARLKTLRLVEVVVGTRVTDDGLRRLKDRLPKCKIPDLELEEVTSPCPALSSP